MDLTSESETSKKLQFIISNSSDTRTRLYKTSKDGLLQPADDMDIVESLLIDAVRNAFKDKRVLLLKSCLKSGSKSPRASRKRVRLLLPPDSRENLPDVSVSERDESGRKVRFLLPTVSKDRREEEESNDEEEEDVSQSFDSSTLDDFDTLQELGGSWDEASLLGQSLDLESDIATDAVPKTGPAEQEVDDVAECVEPSQGEETETLVEPDKTTPEEVDEETTMPSQNNQEEEESDSDASSVKSQQEWNYSDDDFESGDADTDRDIQTEQSSASEGKNGCPDASTTQTTLWANQPRTHGHVQGSEREKNNLLVGSFCSAQFFSQVIRQAVVDGSGITRKCEVSVTAS